MISIEQIYGLQSHLNNILLFKQLFDDGIDLTPFADITLDNIDDPYHVEYRNYDNFHSVATHLFEICEVYRDFRGSEEEEMEEDVKYWLNKSSAKEKFDTSLIIVVLLDPLLKKVTKGAIGACYRNSHVGNAYHIEDGLVLVFDDDYGEPNWTDVMNSLLSSRKQVLQEEEIIHEMAI